MRIISIVNFIQGKSAVITERHTVVEVKESKQSGPDARSLFAQNDKIISRVSGCFGVNWTQIKQNIFPGYLAKSDGRFEMTRRRGMKNIFIFCLLKEPESVNTSNIYIETLLFTLLTF